MTALPPLPSMPDLPRWLPRAVELVLLLALTVLVGRWVLAAFVPAGPEYPGAVTATAPALVAIPANDLFFRRPGTASSGTGSVDGLVLHGLRGGDRPSAILAGPDGVQRAWPVGSEPASGVVLERVAGDHVVLRRGGGTVRLELTARAGTTARVTPAAPPRGAPASTTNAAATTVARPPGPAPAPAPAAEVSAASPAAATGYRLGAEADRLPLRLAGLKPGDEILSINGQPVGEDPASLRERLAGQTRFELRYRRDGRIHTATVGLP